MCMTHCTSMRIVQLSSTLCLCHLTEEEKFILFSHLTLPLYSKLDCLSGHAENLKYIYIYTVL